MHSGMPSSIVHVFQNANIVFNMKIWAEIRNGFANLSYSTHNIK